MTAGDEQIAASVQVLLLSWVRDCSGVGKTGVFQRACLEKGGGKVVNKRVTINPRGRMACRKLVETHQTI